MKIGNTFATVTRLLAAFALVFSFVMFPANPSHSTMYGSAPMIHSDGHADRHSGDATVKSVVDMSSDESVQDAGQTSDICEQNCCVGACSVIALVNSVVLSWATLSMVRYAFTESDRPSVLSGVQFRPPMI